MGQEGHIGGVGAFAARSRTPGLVSRRALAWVLALAQVFLLAQAVFVWTWSGVWFPTELAIAGLVAFAPVGALITSRRVRNQLGWFLLMFPLPAIVSFVLTEYVKLAHLHHASLPFVEVADWVSNWAWAPCLTAIAMIMVRFPDGRVPHRWRFVDWLSVGGTIPIAGAIAVITVWTVGLQFKPPQSLRTVASGLILPTGLAVVAFAALSAATSLVERYRQGSTEIRQQLKWILLAAIVVALAVAYLAVVSSVFRVPFDYAAVPLDVTLIFIPVSIGVAILRHRLFDIDVIISRTLVYVLLTAILGGLFVGLLELMQRLFLIYTGQSSDTAIAISAFVVAGAFTPVQKWLDKTIEQHFGGRDAVATVDNISSSMEAVVRVFDPQGVARWLVDSVVTAFDAEGGLLYLHAHDRSQPFHACGRFTGEAAAEVVVRYDQSEVGRLQLGRRRGGLDYSRRDIDALNAAAASLGKALVLARDLDHVLHGLPSMQSMGGTGAVLAGSRTD